MEKCRVYVDTSLCKGCFICIDICPPKILRSSEEASPLGYYYPVVVGECRGCRLCEFFCPDFSISILCGESGDD